MLLSVGCFEPRAWDFIPFCDTKKKNLSLGPFDMMALPESRQQFTDIYDFILSKKNADVHCDGKLSMYVKCKWVWIFLLVFANIRRKKNNNSAKVCVRIYLVAVLSTIWPTLIIHEIWLLCVTQAWMFGYNKTYTNKRALDTLLP